MNHVPVVIDDGSHNEENTLFVMLIGALVVRVEVEIFEPSHKRFPFESCVNDFTVEPLVIFKSVYSYKSFLDIVINPVESLKLDLDSPKPKLILLGLKRFSSVRDRDPSAFVPMVDDKGLLETTDIVLKQL